jgi:tRNA-Thr(GGU) m(6)t(6)A37 methyltransferase TsaA
MSETSFAVRPIAFVRSPRTDVSDDFWGAVESEIELCSDIPPESLVGLEDYSHVDILFVLDRMSPDDVEYGLRHPRNNLAWPKVGIFAQRAKRRPNRLAHSIVRLLGRNGSRLRVLALDAIDGTPVLDIKPVLSEFLPREPVRQPEYSRELMRDYWLNDPGAAEVDR